MNRRAFIAGLLASAAAPAMPSVAAVAVESDHELMWRLVKLRMEQAHELFAVLVTESIYSEQGSAAGLDEFLRRAGSDGKESCGVKYYDWLEIGAGIAIERKPA